MRQYLKFVALTALVSLPFLGTSHSLEQQVFNGLQETVTATPPPPKQAQPIVVSSLQPVSTLATVAVAVTPAPTPVASSSTVSGCGDNSYANDVYMFESRCSLTAVNPSSGDCGIGQAGPCSKLINACPDWQTDYACQNLFFDNYMANTYGSWAVAWSHELADGWW